MKKNNGSKITLKGYIAFMLTISFVSFICIAVFQLTLISTKNLAVTILVTLLTVLFLAFNCTTIDLVRRKKIDKIIEQILIVTDMVKNGNLSVRLTLSGKDGQYEKFDEIMINLNQMIEELNKKEILNNDFISNFSHEIKTPLTIIQNYVIALQNPSLSPTQRQEYFSTLLSTTNKLTTLTSNILKLNKLEHQVISPNKQEVNIGEFVRQEVLNFVEIIDKKNIELNCEIQDTTIFTDTGLYEIVINNLMSNAIKFTPNNGKISVKLYDSDNQIFLEVSDTGCGMDSETGKHIFEKFYQGDTSHSKEGNGLGLALVKKVVDLLGGKIYVESETNKGSTFMVIFNKD